MCGKELTTTCDPLTLAGIGLFESDRDGGTVLFVGPEKKVGSAFLRPRE